MSAYSYDRESLLSTTWASLSARRHVIPLSDAPAAWPYWRYSKLAEDQLRNLGMRSLIVSGIMTDQCVESAVRDACDLGYLVTLATDACTTGSAERHGLPYVEIEIRQDQIADPAGQAAWADRLARLLPTAYAEFSRP